MGTSDCWSVVVVRHRQVLGDGAGEAIAVVEVGTQQFVHAGGFHIFVSMASCKKRSALPKFRGSARYSSSGMSASWRKIRT